MEFKQFKKFMSNLVNETSTSYKVKWAENFTNSPLYEALSDHKQFPLLNAKYAKEVSAHIDPAHCTHRSRLLQTSIPLTAHIDPVFAAGNSQSQEPRGVEELHTTRPEENPWVHGWSEGGSPTSCGVEIRGAIPFLSTAHPSPVSPALGH